MNRKTKIVATIGPASLDYEVFKNLVREGIDYVRINTAYSTKKQHKTIFNNVQKCPNKNIKIMFDIRSVDKLENIIECNPCLLYTSEYSEHKHLILIAGRYEGIDERVLENIADNVISIGDYDLMGGELPAMIVIESVSRLIKGVLGKKDFLNKRTTEKGGFVEYPQYTRPEVFTTKQGKELKVPEVLLTGNHKDIEDWREKRKKVIEN